MLLEKKKGCIYKVNNVRKKYHLAGSKKVWSSKVSGSVEHRVKIPSAYCFLKHEQTYYNYELQNY